MAYEISLKSGLVPVKINFEDRGDSTTIYINPSDSDLPKRIMECIGRIENKISDVKSVELDENGLPKSDKYIEYCDAINNAVYSSIDYAFGNEVSKELFKYVGAFSIVDGKYFVQSILDELLPVFEKIIKTNQKKANENMNKHLAKYVKK